MGNLNNRNLFSHGSGGWKSEANVSAGLVPFQATLLGLENVVLVSFWLLS
jgi:hypothetical protein